MKLRPAKVLFVDDPDGMEFFADQLKGKSEEAQAMFQVWKEVRTQRGDLRAEGLGPKHPTMIAMGDREVLPGNRLNQQLRNEGG